MALRPAPRRQIRSFLTTMTIPPRLIPQYITGGDTSPLICIRKPDGSPVREAESWEILAMAAAQYVIGHIRGKRLRFVELTVPPNVAFAILGERNVGRTKREAKPREQRKIQLITNDANRTTIHQQLDNHVVIAHHAAHCSGYAWGKNRLPVSGSCV